MWSSGDNTFESCLHKIQTRLFESLRRKQCESCRINSFDHISVTDFPMHNLSYLGDRQSETAELLTAKSQPLSNANAAKKSSHCCYLFRLGHTLPQTARTRREKPPDKPPPLLGSDFRRVRPVRAAHHMRRLQFYNFGIIERQLTYETLHSREH